MIADKHGRPMAAPTNDEMLQIVTISPENAGQRIDVFLTSIDGIATRNTAQKLLADGHVTIGGKTPQKNYKVAAGDVIEYQLPQPVPCETVAEDIPLDIIYEDTHLLVLNKPRGLVVHPGAGNWQGTLVNALLFHCRGELSGIGGVLRPGIVHRLDKDTSGLMVVAKNDAAHQGLAAQLADYSVRRVYNAVVCGVVARDKVRIDAPIGRHPVNRKKMAVIAGRNAVTYVEVLRRFGRHTLVEARLETGRTHQIRVHMAHIGHPVLGDATYGGATPAFAMQGQVLHAAELSFVHPVTAQEMTFSAPAPGYFNDAVENAGGTI